MSAAYSTSEALFLASTAGMLDRGDERAAPVAALGHRCLGRGRCSHVTAGPARAPHVGRGVAVPDTPEGVCDRGEPDDTAADDAGHRGPQRTVTGRIAAIMQAFTCGQPVLGLAELSELTGLPKSTLHRLADQLCQVGWIEREEGGYRVGLRLYELGSLAVEGNRLHDAALPHLQALAARTGMAAQLGVLDKAEVVYLERVVPAPIRLPTRRGGRQPAYCTGLGKVMAAFDDRAARTVLTSAMPRRTAGTITEPFALRSELNRIRDAGVAFDRGEAYEDLVCVAAPIRGRAQVVGAVSLTGPAGRMRWGTTTDAVRTAAGAIWNATVNAGARI